jgi:prepilin-type processing-associated H-X9-DG protein
MNDAADGTSNTLMVSEVVVPKDIGYMGYVGIPRYAGGAGFTTWFPPNGTGDYLARQCYIQDDPGTCTKPGSWTDARHVPFAIITARSKHSGGVNAALMDGSVRFFPSSINIDTWRALSTTQGGESVSP